MIKRSEANSLFSDRYDPILKDADFATDFSMDFRKDLVSVLYHFNAPTGYKPSRYDNWVENIDTSFIVFRTFCTKKGFSLEDADKVDMEWLVKRDYHELLDIIELWAIELYETEQSDFHNDLNEVFVDYDQPWRLLQGRVIRIDSKQFEQDLILKTMELLTLRVSDVLIFQNAQREYIDAIECFNRHDYRKAVLNAEISYESVLKIVGNLTSGQADTLTKAFINTQYVSDIPSQINREGFRSNVLTALPFLRNQLKVGHGEGGESIIITPALAKMSLNLAATLITFIIEQYKTHLIVQSEVSDEDDLPF